LKDASVVRRRAGRKRPEFDESGTSPSSLSCWLRFSARGAHLAWRVKNGAKSVPFKILRTLPDGSELVLLRESDSMLARRRRENKDKALPRLPDTVARLVSFTITARTARRAKTTTIKVLTTLLGADTYPAREIAALYAERWQIEVGHRWGRSSCAAFSWLCSLFLVGLVFLRCPAGAGVVAGRACPAFA
jgi:Transposase DDE domain